MENVTSIRELFTDKRDKNYYKLISELRFFDLFASKTNKFSTLIPETIIMSKMQFKYWFFNSHKDASNEILMRKPKYMNSLDIFKRFSPLAKEVDTCTVPIQIIERLKFEEPAHDPIHFIRCTDGEKFLASGLELLRLLEDRPQQISMIHQILDLNRKSDYSRDTYITYYRNDTESAFPIFAFYKKTFSIGEKGGLKLSTLAADRWSKVEKNPNYPGVVRKNIDFCFNSHQEDFSCDPGNPVMKKLFSNENIPALRLERELIRGYINKVTPRHYYKSVDGALNAKLEEKTKELVQFIEKSYKIRIRKLIVKHLQNSKQQIVFIGCEELLFDLVENCEYDTEKLRLNIQADGGKIDLNSLLRYQSTFVQNKEVPLFKYQDPNVLKVEEGQEAVTAIRKRPMSTNLFARMVIPVCQGDFCEFYVASVDKASYDIPAHLRTKITIVKKERLQDFINIPFKIPRLLKVKCRERIAETTKVLRKNLIFPQALQNVDRCELEEMEDVINSIIQKKIGHKKEFSNLDNLYRNLSVCKTCFTIYSIMSKYFEEHQESLAEFSQFQKRLSTKSASRLHTRNSESPGGRHSRFARSSMRTEKTESSMDREQRLSNIRHLTQEDSLRKSTTTAALDLDKIFSVLDYHKHFGIARLAGAFKRGVYASRPVSKTGGDRFFGKPSKVQSKNEQISNGSRMALGLMVYTKLNESVPTIQKPATTKTTKIRSMNNLFTMFTSTPAATLTQLNNIRSPSAGAVHRRIPSQGDERTPLGDSRLHESFGKVSRVAFEQNFRQFTPTNRNEKRKFIQLRGNSPGEESKKSLESFPPESKVIKTTGIPFKIESLYHKYLQFGHLRILPPHKMTTPTTSFTLEKNTTEFFAISLEKFCESTKKKMPSCPKAKKIQFFVYDYEVGIPFLVLNSPKGDMNDSRPLKNTKTLVILHDFFDSFMEYIELYDRFLLDKLDTKIVLCNIPGQAYTKYSDQEQLRNSDMASVIDSLLNYLESQKAINFLTEDVFFIGFGYGANILAYLLGASESCIDSIKGLLMFNGFSYVTHLAKGIFDKMTEVFLEMPPENRELPFDYYNVICSGKTLEPAYREKKLALNAIDISGRLYVLRSLDNMLDFTQQIQRLKYPVFAVQSDKDIFITPEMIDQMLKEHGDIYKVGQVLRGTASLVGNSQRRSVRTFENGKPIRMSFFYDGPHNIIETDEQRVFDIINDFLNCADEGFENLK